MTESLRGPQIDQERCSLCGLCVSICPHHNLRKGQQLEVIDPDNCDCCGLCEELCPEGAVHCEFEIVWAQAPACEANNSDGGKNA